MIFFFCFEIVSLKMSKNEKQMFDENNQTDEQSLPSTRLWRIWIIERENTNSNCRKINNKFKNRRENTNTDVNAVRFIVDAYLCNLNSFQIIVRFSYEYRNKISNTDQSSIILCIEFLYYTHFDAIMYWQKTSFWFIKFANEKKRKKKKLNK